MSPKAKRKTAASTTLGERVRALRLGIDGATQERVSQLAGIDLTNYGDIERGFGNPTFETLLRIAAVLQVPASDLITGLTRADLPDDDPDLTVAEFIAARKQRRLAP
ncbi:helix-turn-helix domain-containing protein [Gryllotalpicola reticulitermitis]|uniref:Helix-turn-helix domain-containing protein n=1 Tax=Gryllotalpicola reticulitermitis TaxID=1184153 RepID=A0ABV8Q9S1_9MICO